MQRPPPAHRRPGQAPRRHAPRRCRCTTRRIAPAAFSSADSNAFDFLSDSASMVSSSFGVMSARSHIPSRPRQLLRFLFELLLELLGVTWAASPPSPVSRRIGAGSRSASRTGASFFAAAPGAPARPSSRRPSFPAPFASSFLTHQARPFSLVDRGPDSAPIPSMPPAHHGPSPPRPPRRMPPRLQLHRPSLGGGPPGPAVARWCSPGCCLCPLLARPLRVPASQATRCDRRRKAAARDC